MSLPGALQKATLYISIKVKLAVNTPQVAYILLFDEMYVSPFCAGTEFRICHLLSSDSDVYIAKNSLINECLVIVNVKVRMETGQLYHGSSIR